ncbi:MAG: SO2930 family diheme c-type cytochrome [Myxococcales bacterium]
MKRALAGALAGALCGCGAGSGGYCGLDGGAYLAAPCQKLSDYGLVSIQDGGIVMAPSVVPYDLNTPLFSDYAVKVRGVWVPPGAQATYDPTNAFAFPTGTILIKSFGFAASLAAPTQDVTWVETRLLINAGDAGWKPVAYVWDADQHDATADYAGEVTPLSWLDADGGTIDTQYLVPSANQCKQCHNLYGVPTPIGPKARQLNKSFSYASGPENELAHWTAAGILAGAPDPSEAPVLPVWNDPATGTVAQRARAYLEGNCAHCHNPGGSALTTGLYLWASETDPSAYGVCKAPVAAGPATGGNRFDVVPGDPAHSIIPYRMASDTPSIAMPQIGRSVVDVAGNALVTEWIGEMDGGCP